MSGWEVGDLAVCVDAGPSRTSIYSVLNLECGKLYRVLEVTVRHYGTCLLIDGARSEHPSGQYRARRFRKILPDRHEGELSDWEILLDTMKPKVRA